MPVNPRARHLLSWLGALILASSPVHAVETAKQPEPPARYIVHFRHAQARAAEPGLRAHAARVMHRFDRLEAVSVEATPERAGALARDPAVVRVERDAPRFPVTATRSHASGADITPLGTSSSSQVVPYGVEMVQARGFSGAWNAPLSVCVIDSGYDLGHEDLPGSSRVTGIDDIGGTGRWYRDGDGHGTHVAGTINARNNTVGVQGVFPGARLFVVKVFGSGGGWAYSSDLVAALDKCIASGARIVNMSLGGPDATALEKNAFAAARAGGVLPVASAGNDGVTSLYYPASYPSVVSVAAVDADGMHADFSNRNARIVLAAPGVSVLSTVPRGSIWDAFVHGSKGTIAAVPMDNFSKPPEPIVAPLADCGLAAKAADCHGAAGALCLIERGTYLFSEKTESCRQAGGVGAIIYNKPDDSGPVRGTLGSYASTIPVVGIERSAGLGLLESDIGKYVTVDMQQSEYNYDYYDGTSMAAPHVSAVAALLWSRHLPCTADEIRSTLIRSAMDLGEPGRDNLYGYGLVQLRSAHRYLRSHPCIAE